MKRFRKMSRGVMLSLVLASVAVPGSGGATAFASGTAPGSTTPEASSDTTAAPESTEAPATTEAPTTEAPASTAAPTTEAPATTAAPAPASPQLPESMPPVSPPVSPLVTPLSGQAAVDALRAGAPLDPASLFPGQSLTRDDVMELLAHDPTLHLVGDKLLYIDKGYSGDEAAEMAAIEEVPVSDAEAAAAFGLHSKPNSKKKIYLDFNGNVTKDWEQGKTTRSAPYDTDGNPNSFSRAERAQIVRWWNQVSADFDTWDVDVTTQEPALSYLTKKSASDDTYGVRVVITPTNIYPGTAGVAYVGSVLWSTDTPALVFTDANTGSPPAYVHQVITHEVGHTLGLNHDGTFAHGSEGRQEYYGGHNNWAPVMGGGRIKQVVQWSKGEYAYSNNREDDRRVITRVFKLIPDDYARFAAGIGSNRPRLGLINSASDIDRFQFRTKGGSVKISVSRKRPSSQLDLKLIVRNQAGRLVKVANSPGLGAETIRMNLPAGRYYITVDGAGARSPRFTGYSDYSSVGAYKLVATYR